VPARFVVLEGIDGSGTTTQCARLAAILRGRGLDVHETREPSDGAIGKLTRSLLGAHAKTDAQTLALLFAADRLDHVVREIEPALARGATVLCDRYVLSSWAYQSLDCELAWVRTLNERARWPDLTILLDVDAEVAFARVEARRARGEAAEDRWDRLATQERLAASYRALATDPALMGVHVVRGDGSIDEVTAALSSLIDAAAQSTIR
jgi:dTMP kinase